MAATNDLIPDFDDFERYYSGEMPSAEQRSLEGRMLDEPLVAEAYEGFLAWREQHTGTASVHADLRERLYARVMPARRNALPLWTYASAASVILVLFVYWSLFLNDQKASTPETTVGIKEEKAVPPASVREHTPAPIQPEKPFEPVASARAQVARPAAPVLPEQPRLSTQPLPKAETPAAPSVSEESRDEAADIALVDSFKGKAETILVPPEPSKALATPGSAQAIGKSMAARVRMEPSSLHNVAKESDGTAQQFARAQIALPEQEQRHKKETKYYPIPPDAPAPAPAGGWSAYREYLGENTRSATTTGEIVVTFVVGPSGALSGFMARGPEELQKEAIRIIRSGPAWAPARAHGAAVASLAEVRLQFRQSQ